MAVEGITGMCENVSDTLNALVKGVTEMVMLPITVLDTMMDTMQSVCQK